MTSQTSPSNNFRTKVEKPCSPASREKFKNIQGLFKNEKMYIFKGYSAYAFQIHTVSYSQLNSHSLLLARKHT